MHTLVAYLAALLAAFTFAMSAVLQQESARKLPEEDSLSPKMAVDLVRDRSWLAGVGAMVGAYLLQAIALGFGPVAVVEPIIVTELIFAVPIAVRHAGRRPGLREWSGMLLAAAGVGAFLVAAHPAGGQATPSILRWGYGFVPWAVVATLLVLASRGPAGPRRAGLLAAAAGVTFGLLSLLTKSMIAVLTHHGFVSMLTSWQPWVVLTVGALGFLVSQSAYQAAPLASSLPLMDTIEPIVAVVLAAYVLREGISLSAADLAVETVGMLGTVVGVFLLGRSPLVLAIYEAGEQRKKRGRGGRRPGAGDEPTSAGGATPRQDRDSRSA